MKILIVLLRLSGGVGTANKEIANSLRKKGHEVEILSREDDLKIYSLFRSIFPLRKKIRRLMKERNYDIIYTQDYSMAIPMLFPYPIFWKKHFYCSIGIKNKGVPKFIQITIGRIMGSKTIVIFDHNKKRFPKAHVIYRGVNLERFKPLRKKREYFGFMNKFSEMGDSKIYEKVAKDFGLKLIFAGDSSEKIQYVKKIGGNERIHSFNKFSDKKMNKFYNKCKVFINLTTPDAGFNLSWLEAMSAGVPIVIGNNNGAGPMMPFDKILSLKNLEKDIKKIFKNPKKINYRKWLIDNRFTWDNSTDKLIKIFKGEFGEKLI